VTGSGDTDVAEDRREGLHSTVMAIGDLEDKLLDELRGMRDDFRKVSSEVAALTVEVKHLAADMSDTRGHGERIKALETDVSNLKARDESAATERRWIIGMLVSGALVIIGIIVSLLVKR
jgi:hypothetical protein